MKVAVISTLIHYLTITTSIGASVAQVVEGRTAGGGEYGGRALHSSRDALTQHTVNYNKDTFDDDLDAVSTALQETSSERVERGRGKTNTLRQPHQDCNNNDIAECVDLLEVLTNKDLGFAASVDELNRMCPVLLNGLQCIDNYTRRCLTLKHREYFNKLYAGTIRVIKDLCNTKGKYQQEYIRHAPCMRQVNPKYNQCSEIYHRKTAGLNQINDATVQLSEDEKNKNVITLCCSFQEYLQCSERVVYETCGNETALFTKEFLDRMAGPIVQDLCQAFSFSLHSCLQESSTASPRMSPQAAAFFLNKASSLFGQETRNNSFNSSHTVESRSRDSSRRTTETNAFDLSSNPQEDHRPYFKSTIRQSLQAKMGQALMKSLADLDPTNEPPPTLVFTHGTTVRPPTLPPFPPMWPASSDTSPVNADSPTTFQAFTQKSKTHTQFSKESLIKDVDSSSSAMVELTVVTSPVIHSTLHRLKTRELHDKEEQNSSTYVDQLDVLPVPFGSDMQHKHEKFDNTTNSNASHSAALLQDELLTSLVRHVNNSSFLSTGQTDSSVLTPVSESSLLNSEDLGSVSLSASFLPNSSISSPSFSYKRPRQLSGVAKNRRLINLHRPGVVKKPGDFINTTSRPPSHLPVTGGSTTVANDWREDHTTSEIDHPHSVGPSQNITLLPRRRPRIRHSWRHFHRRSGQHGSRWQMKPNFMSQESFMRSSQNMTITTGEDERFVKKRPNHRPKLPIRRRPLPKAHQSNSTEKHVGEDEVHLQYQHGNESKYASGTSKNAMGEPKMKQEIQQLKTESNESRKAASQPEVTRAVRHPEPGVRDFNINVTIPLRQAGNGYNSKTFPRKLGKRRPYQDSRPLKNRRWNSRFPRRRINRGKTPSRQRGEISSDSGVTPMVSLTSHPPKVIGRTGSAITTRPPPAGPEVGERSEDARIASPLASLTHIEENEEAHIEKINTHQTHNGVAQVTSRPTYTTESNDGSKTVTESPGSHVATTTQSTGVVHIVPNIGAYLDKVEKTVIGAEGDTTMVETARLDKVTENNKSIRYDNEDSYDEYHYSDHDFDGFEGHHTEENINCHRAEQQSKKHNDSNLVSAEQRSVIYDSATPKASNEHDKFKLLDMTQLSNTSGIYVHEENDVKYYKGGYHCNIHHYTSATKTSSSHDGDNEKELDDMDDKSVLRTKQLAITDEDNSVEVRTTEEGPLIGSGEDGPLIGSEDGPLIGSGEDGPLIGSGEEGPLIGSGENSDTLLPTSSAEAFYLWFRNRLEEEVKEAVIPAPTPVPYVIQLRKEQETKRGSSANFAPVILDILESDFIPLVNPSPRNIDNGEDSEDFTRLKIDMPANEYVSYAKPGNTEDEAHLQTTTDLTRHITSSGKSIQTLQVGQPDTPTSITSEDGIRNMEENLTNKKSKHSEHMINRDSKIKPEDGKKNILDETTRFSSTDALRLDPSSHITRGTSLQSLVSVNDTEIYTKTINFSSNTNSDELIGTRKGQTAGEDARAKFPVVLPTPVTEGTSTRIITNFTRRSKSKYNEETSGVTPSFSTPDDTRAAGTGSREVRQHQATEQHLLHADGRNLTETLEFNKGNKAASVKSNPTSAENLQVVRVEHQGELDQVTVGSHPGAAAMNTCPLLKTIVLSVFCTWVIL